MLLSPNIKLKLDALVVSAHFQPTHWTVAASKPQDMVRSPNRKRRSLRKLLKPITSTKTNSILSKLTERIDNASQQPRKETTVVPQPISCISKVHTRLKLPQQRTIKQRMPWVEREPNASEERVSNISIKLVAKTKTNWIHSMVRTFAAAVLVPVMPN